MSRWFILHALGSRHLLKHALSPLLISDGAVADNSPETMQGIIWLGKSKAAQEKISYACEDLFLRRAIGQHACNLDGSDHR